MCQTIAEITSTFRAFDIATKALAEVSFTLTPTKYL
jgi:hypothetical protein